MRLIDIDSFDNWHDDGWDLYAYRQDIDKMPTIDAEKLYSMVFKSGYDKGLRDALKELSGCIGRNITYNDKSQIEKRTSK